MIRSMTGFARRERTAPFGTLAWELRTVNHRYLEVTLRLPEEFRPSEGGRIAELLLGRCGGVETIANEVSSRLPEIRERIRTRLNDRLSQVAVEPNPDRLEQEIVIALQKMDVDEELDRLRSHVVEMRKVIDADEPAGRRLDFLMQEFNREANTLSSKSQDVETTRAAVDMKVLIEQMREQVQNVE